MPVIETVLIYAVIPLAVCLLFAVLTLVPGRGRDKTVYRPGQPWEHDPVWYEPHPDAAGVPAASHGASHEDVASGRGRLGSGARRPGPGEVAAALTIGERPHVNHSFDGAPGADDSSAGPRRTAAGGARGTW